jgi:signal transduction histidine kinase
MKRLTDFITESMDQILAEWDKYALTLKPAADELTLKELRDHAESMLREIADDLCCEQTAQAQIKKSQGTEDNTVSSAAAKHGKGRHLDNFTLIQLSGEFRALRATVLRMWLPNIDKDAAETLDDVVRFNEAIDQAFAESIVTFSERTEEARDRYDAILGHDLRGPLATISMAGALLSQPLTEGQAAKLAASVRRSAAFMTAMVDDLLALSWIKLADGLLIRRTPVDLSVLAEAAVEDALAMHPECEFKLTSTGNASAQLDSLKMHQMLVNLIGNAGQHGAPHKPILVAVDGSGDMVDFSVSNEGRRIPAAALKKIFEPMVQLEPGDRSSIPAKTSLGLGLHIAREIVVAHGGTITAASTDACTTFSVCLPREQAASH